MGYEAVSSILIGAFVLLFITICVTAFSKQHKYLYIAAPLSAVVIATYLHLSYTSLWTNYSLGFELNPFYSIMMTLACLVLLFVLVTSYNIALQRMKSLIAKVVIVAITIWFSLILIALAYNELVIIYFFNVGVYSAKYISTDRTTHLSACTNSKMLYRKINKKGQVSFLCPYASGMFNKIYDVDFIPVGYYFTMKPQDFKQLKALNPAWNENLYHTIQSGVKHHLRINVNGTIYQVIPRSVLKHDIKQMQVREQKK